MAKARLAEYRTILDRGLIDTDLLFNNMINGAWPKRHLRNNSRPPPPFTAGGRGKMKVEDENADDEKDRKEADEVMFCRFSVGDLVQVWFKFSC